MRGNELLATKLSDTIKRYKETGSAIPEKRSGWPKILTQRDTQVLRRIVCTDRFSPLGDITNRLNSSLNTTLHQSTVRRYLHGVDGRVKVWRSPGEAYNKDCIQPTVKFGGGSVMFWGCFGWHGVGPLVVIDGNMNSNDYVNVLANHFISWMRTHNVPMLDLVAQSLDLNPIENLWDHLDHQVQKRKPLPKSKQELISVVQEKWRKISIETLHHLILSLPSRIKAVIKAKGGHTKY
ncbi:unnamed protein product [Rhizophagus irregularis]|nr:unnamed protein product [Rhizophagus irregularis]